MEDKQPKENKLRIAIIVLMSIALIGVGTYAIGSGFGITNSDYSYHTACFDVSYDITNDDGTRDISGNLIPGENYMDGLNGQVSIHLDPSCGLTGLGNLYLKIDDDGGGSTAVQTVRPHCENPETLETLTEYTDEESCSASANGKWVTTGSALKYAVYEYNSDRIVSVGYVNKVNEKINIHNDFDVIELVKFDIYVWLDGNLVDNSYINLSLRGAISADVVQISGNMVSSPSAPVLDDGMIPVTIANDGVVTTISNTDSAWYNYNNKEWANIILVDRGTDTDRITDYSGNNTTATVNGPTLNDNGLKFDGTDDEVSLPNIQISSLTGFTVETEIMFDSYPSGKVDFISNYEAGGFGIEMTADGIVRFAIYDADSVGYVIVSSDFALEVGKRYLTTGVYDGSNISLYINGEFISSASIGAIGDSTTFTSLGCNPSTTGSCNGNYFNGTIYSARFYNRALSNEEVLNNYNGNIVKDNLKFYYDFENGKRTAYKNSTGVVVNQDDILAYYVWIPRYKYKIWDVTGTSSPLTISVMFESKLEEPTYGTTLGSWRTHPAFIWDGNPVAGIWVGKFEATGSADVPTVLPNNITLANQNVGDQFTTALKFAGGTFSDGNVRFAGSDTYGLSKNTDSHMMKNSEWGAVAYLSHSKYGIDKEIMINNYPYTGCRATEENAESSDTCQIFYGETSHYSQTTTGNITGLFDVSGGIWEYTMANYNGLFTETNGFTVLPPTKYYDKYTSMDPLTACNGGICFGHAISETKDWYNDYFYMTDEQYLWSARGGANYGGINSGAFALSRDDGNPHTFLSWRSVLVNVEKHAIKYNPNGGIGTMSDIDCAYGASCTLSTNTFTRTGYTFAGWNTSADGTGTSYSDGYTISEYNYDSDITLYAQWSVHNVYIQFDTEGGTIASPTTLEGINYTWTADSNGIISRSADGGDYNNKWFNISYGAERNLPNYDYADYINISKTGYSAVSEAEWKCLSGCSTSGATFNDLLDYSSDAFCDASNGDCTVVLGVNWNANTYAIKYYLGNGTSTAGSTMLGTSECTYGSTSCKLSKFSATFPNSTNGWSFAGWGTSNSDTSVDYNDEKTFDNSITEDMSLYAIGSRTLNFYSGTAGESIGSKTQYWNPYSINTSYYTSITPPAATSLSAYGWSCRGFRGNNIASSTYAAPCTGSYTPPPNELTSFDFRTIYKRTLTLKFDGNGSTSGSTSDISETQYFNSGMNNSGQNVSAVSFTLPSNGFTKTNYAFSNWCETTAGGGTCTAAGGTYSAWTPAVNTTTVTKTLYASWNRVYSNTWVDGKSSSFEVTPNSVGGSANVTLKIFWKESYNEYLNQSKVSITNVQAKISARTGYVYYLGGSDAESSTSSGIYINGTRNYAMSTYTGGYNVYLGSANTYVSITSKNAFPWTSAAITHSSDGTKTIPIRVYLNVVRQTSPGSYYSKFDKTTNITLTDLR